MKDIKQTQEPFFISPDDIETAFLAEETEYDTDFYKNIREEVRKYFVKIRRNYPLADLAKMFGLDPMFIFKKIIPPNMRSSIGEAPQVPVIVIPFAADYED